MSKVVARGIVVAFYALTAVVVARVFYAFWRYESPLVAVTLFVGVPVCLTALIWADYTLRR